MKRGEIRLPQTDTSEHSRDPALRETPVSSSVVPAASIQIHAGMERVVAKDYGGAAINSISMRDNLTAVEAALPHLLQTPEDWYGMRIDEGRLLRLFRTVPGGYIYLHRAEPCLPEDLPTYHYHQWKSAIHVLPEEDDTGEYEVGFGYGPGDESPPVFTRILIPSGGEFQYEMNHEDGWHYIKPMGSKPRWSVMVTGERYANRSAPKVAMSLRAFEQSQMDNGTRLDIHGEFCRRFPMPQD